jgi:lipopolysaccharide export LptBFGC system permease protein LptF
MERAFFYLLTFCFVVLTALVSFLALVDVLPPLAGAIVAAGLLALAMTAAREAERE